MYVFVCLLLENAKNIFEDLRLMAFMFFLFTCIANCCSFSPFFFYITVLTFIVKNQILGQYIRKKEIMTNKISWIYKVMSFLRGKKSYSDIAIYIRNEIFPSWIPYFLSMMSRNVPRWRITGRFRQEKTENHWNMEAVFRREAFP